MTRRRFVYASPPRLTSPPRLVGGNPKNIVGQKLHSIPLRTGMLPTSVPVHVGRLGGGNLRGGGVAAGARGGMLSVSPPRNINMFVGAGNKSSHRPVGAAASRLPEEGPENNYIVVEDNNDVEKTDKQERSSPEDTRSNTRGILKSPPRVVHRQRLSPVRVPSLKISPPPGFNPPARYTRPPLKPAPTFVPTGTSTTRRVVRNGAITATISPPASNPQDEFTKNPTGEEHNNINPPRTSLTGTGRRTSRVASRGSARFDRPSACGLDALAAFQGGDSRSPDLKRRGRITAPVASTPTASQLAAVGNIEVDLGVSGNATSGSTSGVPSPELEEENLVLGGADGTADGEGVGAEGADCTGSRGKHKEDEEENVVFHADLAEESEMLEDKARESGVFEDFQGPGGTTNEDTLLVPASTTAHQPPRATTPQVTDCE